MLNQANQTHKEGRRRRKRGEEKIMGSSMGPRQWPQLTLAITLCLVAIVCVHAGDDYSPYACQSPPPPSPKYVATLNCTDIDT